MAEAEVELITEETEDLTEFPQFKELQQHVQMLTENVGSLEQKLDEVYVMLDAYETTLKSMRDTVEGSILIDRQDFTNKLASVMAGQVAAFTGRKTRVMKPLE